MAGKGRKKDKSKSAAEEPVEVDASEAKSEQSSGVQKPPPGYQPLPQKSQSKKDFIEEELSKFGITWEEFKSDPKYELAREHPNSVRLLSDEETGEAETPSPSAAPAVSSAAAAEPSPPEVVRDPAAKAPPPVVPSMPPLGVVVEGSSPPTDVEVAPGPVTGGDASGLQPVPQAESRPLFKPSLRIQDPSLFSKLAVSKVFGLNILTAHPCEAMEIPVPGLDLSRKACRELYRIAQRFQPMYHGLTFPVPQLGIDDAKQGWSPLLPFQQQTAAFVEPQLLEVRSIVNRIDPAFNPVYNEDHAFQLSVMPEGPDARKLCHTVSVNPHVFDDVARGVRLGAQQYMAVDDLLRSAFVDNDLAERMIRRAVYDEVDQIRPDMMRVTVVERPGWGAGDELAFMQRLLNDHRVAVAKSAIGPSFTTALSAQQLMVDAEPLPAPIGPPAQVNTSSILSTASRAFGLDFLKTIAAFCNGGFRRELQVDLTVGGDSPMLGAVSAFMMLALIEQTYLTTQSQLNLWMLLLRPFFPDAGEGLDFQGRGESLADLADRVRTAPGDPQLPNMRGQLRGMASYQVRTVRQAMRNTVLETIRFLKSTQWQTFTSGRTSIFYDNRTDDIPTPVHDAMEYVGLIEKGADDAEQPRRVWFARFLAQAAAINTHFMNYVEALSSLRSCHHIDQALSQHFTNHYHLATTLGTLLYGQVKGVRKECYPSAGNPNETAIATTVVPLVGAFAAYRNGAVIKDMSGEMFPLTLHVDAQVPSKLPKYLYLEGAIVKHVLSEVRRLHEGFLERNRPEVINTIRAILSVYYTQLPPEFEERVTEYTYNSDILDDLVVPANLLRPSANRAEYVANDGEVLDSLQTYLGGTPLRSVVDWMDERVPVANGGAVADDEDPNDAGRLQLARAMIPRAPSRFNIDRVLHVRERTTTTVYISRFGMRSKVYCDVEGAPHFIYGYDDDQVADGVEDVYDFLDVYKSMMQVQDSRPRTEDEIMTMGEAYHRLQEEDPDADVSDVIIKIEGVAFKFDFKPDSLASDMYRSVPGVTVEMKSDIFEMKVTLSEPVSVPVLQAYSHGVPPSIGKFATASAEKRGTVLGYMKGLLLEEPPPHLRFRLGLKFSDIERFLVSYSSPLPIYDGEFYTNPKTTVQAGEDILYSRFSLTGRQTEVVDVVEELEVRSLRQLQP